MSDSNVNLNVNLRGNLERRAQLYSQSLGRMSARSRRHLALMQRGAAKVDGAISRMGNRYLALGSGGAIAVAAKSVLDFDAELTQLGVDADITDKRLANIKDRLHEVASAADIKVNRNDLLAGVKEITARTGDVDVALDNLRNIGLVMRATGANAQDSAALVANYFEKFGIKNPQQMLQVLSESAVLGKQGAFELRDLATEGNSVSAAYAATGRTGPKAIREMNTMLQIVRRTAPSAAEAATMFERLISTITAEKVGVFQSAGIQIWDEQELARGKKIARAVPDIIKDILRVSNADQEELVKVFDIKALQGLNAFAAEFRATGAVESIDKYMSVLDDGSQLLSDAGRNAQTARAAINTLTNAFARFADTELSEPIQAIADGINALDADKVDDILQNTKQWAIALAAVYATYKGIQGINAAFQLYKNIKNPVGDATDALGAKGGSLANPMYVFVTNQGAGGFNKNRKGGGNIRTAGAAGAGAALAKESDKLIGAATKLLGVATVGVASYEIATALGADKLLSGTKAGDFVGEAIAHVLAGLGNQDALAALKANGDLQTFKGRPSRSKALAEKNEAAEVVLKIEGDASKVKVRLGRTNNRAPVVNVTGQTMGVH